MVIVKKTILTMCSSKCRQRAWVSEATLVFLEKRNPVISFVCGTNYTSLVNCWHQRLPGVVTDNFNEVWAKLNHFFVRLVENNDNLHDTSQPGSYKQSPRTISISFETSDTKNEEGYEVLLVTA